MNNTQIVDSLLSEKYFIHDSALTAIRLQALQLLSGNVVIEEKEDLKLAYYDTGLNEIQSENNQPEQKAVAVLPIRGPIVKFGNWCYWGADEYAMFLDEMYADENISAIILDSHTPGGMVYAGPDMVDAINRRNKPVICLINSCAFSLGAYFMVACDEVIAVNEAICETGSIGIVAELLDDSEMLKGFGIKKIKIYPPESKHKHEAVRKALAGDDSVMIKYELSPLATHFQEHIKKYRPNLKADTDRLLTGGELFAKEALEAGLIDKIMPLNDTIAHALVLADRMEFTNSIIV